MYDIKKINRKKIKKEKGILRKTKTNLKEFVLARKYKARKYKARVENLKRIENVKRIENLKRIEEKEKHILPLIKKDMEKNL